MKFRENLKFYLDFLAIFCVLLKMIKMQNTQSEMIADVSFGMLVDILWYIRCLSIPFVKISLRIKRASIPMNKGVKY